MTLFLKAPLKAALLIILILGQGAAYAKEYKISHKQNLCSNPKYVNAIHGLWKYRKPTYQRWIKTSDKSPYNLYNIQQETNNLLKYAWGCKDQYIINELNSLYLGSILTLDSTNKYAFYYYPEDKRQSVHPLHAYYKMWLDNKEPIGNESILASSQFLALISELINYIVEVPIQNRTSTMKQLIKEFTPVLIEHYDRWIFKTPGSFQVRGWGCKYNNHYVKTGMNHSDYLIKKKLYQLGNNINHAYCNAVFDTDLWIISGVTNLLASHKKDPASIAIPKSAQKKFRSYLNTGIELITQRLKQTELSNYDGKTVQGIIFDAGIWSDYADYQYAGMNGKNFTTIKKLTKSRIKKKSKNVGWDISHARRFVHVFETLDANRELLGINFPSQKIITGLTNQLLYKVFNNNFKYPLFKNFMDGSNGWFRVNYSGRKGYGYGPWDMSSTVLTGGFALWSPYNKDIKKLYNSLNTMINSKDPKVKSHTKEYYERHIWHNYKRSASYSLKDRYYPSTQTMLIQLLPSMYRFSNNAELPLIN